MAKFKLVLGTKSGKTFQREVEGPEAEHFLKKSIGDTVSGDGAGFAGYEFEVTGGSDKCGFPMRKGIQTHRKRIRTGEGVGFSGKNRNKKTQKGLVKKRTVCGETITRIIHQINLKVTKEGKDSLEAKEEAPAEEAPAEQAQFEK